MVEENRGNRANRGEGQGVMESKRLIDGVMAGGAASHPCSLVSVEFSDNNMFIFVFLETACVGDYGHFLRDIIVEAEHLRRGWALALGGDGEEEKRHQLLKGAERHQLLKKRGTSYSRELRGPSSPYVSVPDRQVMSLVQVIEALSPCSCHGQRQGEENISLIHRATHLCQFRGPRGACREIHEYLSNKMEETYQMAVLDLVTSISVGGRCVWGLEALLYVLLLRCPDCGTAFHSKDNKYLNQYSNLFFAFASKKRDSRNQDSQSFWDFWRSWKNFENPKIGCGKLALWKLKDWWSACSDDMFSVPARTPDEGLETRLWRSSRSGGRVVLGEGENWLAGTA